MPAFDASSIIHAWDNYPPEQFPGLWEWMGEQTESGELVILNVAFDEVLRRLPDCSNWLDDHGIQKMTITNETLQIALVINGLLGIENDKYHNNGVGENDIFIIASAKEHRQELVSNENRQNNLPNDMKKYKIPAVCNLRDVDVTCLNFLEFIRKSRAVFR